MLRRQLLLVLILLPSLGLLAFLVAVPRFGQGLTISVLAEAASESDPVAQAQSRRALKRSLDEFGRLNPGVKVMLRVVPAAALVNELSYRSARGLRPDLLVLSGNAPVVKYLYRSGFISAVELSEQERRNIRPELLDLQRLNGKQIAVPIYLWTALACYNSRRMPVPTTQIVDLIRLSQENHAIGLDSSLDDLDWVFSGFGVPATFSS
jgi:ABC-type glycerol-3-phosphate transport system substrate-binding protein